MGLTSEEKDKGLAQLREPFPASQVGLLPRITCGDCSRAQGRCCNQHNKSKCNGCGNWITERHIHLDYVGHGAVTARLLEVDPEWSWKPLAFDESSGMPVFIYDKNLNPVSFWIELTVLGVTRLGVGTCPSNQSDAEKVLIGDALRNAAMRFGVALDLWIKGHGEDDERTSAVDERPAPDRSKPKTISEANIDRFKAQCHERGVNVSEVVSDATDGRTDDPAEVLISEVPQLRSALDRIANEVHGDDGADVDDTADKF